MLQTGSVYSQPPYGWGQMAVGASPPDQSPKFTLMEIGAGAVAVVLILVAARYGYKRVF